MKIYNKLMNSIRRFPNTIKRFPMTTVFIIAIAVLDAMMINNYDLALEKYVISLAVGTFLSAMFQMLYERFFNRNIVRMLLMFITIILTVFYYLIIGDKTELGQELLIKTMVAVFGIFVAFLWIPSIRSIITFNECFMASFKAFFLALLFSGVIMAGLSMIYGATDILILKLNEDIYIHTANIVFVVFATIYFLALTPKYPGRIEVSKNDNATIELTKATTTPKIIEVLISYIVIPMSIIFTLIILIYIVTNITGSFWSDALLEPMLVSYIIAVILIYILSSRMDNSLAKLFRKVFPKVLLPIVIFQTVNSILRIGGFGLTFGRYYVIMFGIFAFIVGVVFSLKPVEKNGIVPMVLIICIVVSLLPGIDAFTISRKSQIDMLQKVLVENEMLEYGKIIPKGDIDESSKKRIITTTEYLQNMGYIEEIAWFPKEYNDFEKTFGFSNYQLQSIEEGISLRTDMSSPVDIEDFDFLIETHISNYEYGLDESKEYEFEKDNKSYNLLFEEQEENILISLYDSDKNELINVNSKDIIDRFANYSLSDEMMPIEDAYLVSENKECTINILVQYIETYKNDEEYDFNMEVYILIKIK